MVKVKTLEQALTDPNFKPGWKLLPNEQGIEDLPKWGAVVIVAVYKDDGTFSHDQHMMLANPGAVGVPWYKPEGEQEERFGLITQIRPVVVLPEIYMKLWDEFVGRWQRDKGRKYEYIQDFLTKLTHYQGTFKSMEFPSGYRKISDTGMEDSLQTVIAEIKEELGAEPKHVKPIGYINPQSLSTYHIPAFSGEIDNKGILRPKHESTEQIVKGEFMTRGEIYSRIRSMRITNGLTLSALTLYDAHRG
ncbi:MAG: hypothetical protein HYW24_05070 [Candidatus Aenigmarchaeota archaeon]|nr:hypothetical protein [Candidatus Aenigmarchaeota archaeon]